MPLRKYLEKDESHPLFVFYDKWFNARNVGEKGCGFYVVFMILLPALLLILLVLRSILKCFCACLCGKKKDDKKTKTA